MKSITVTLDGQQWTIREVAWLVDAWGDCNHKTREIRIARHVKRTTRNGRKCEPYMHEITDEEKLDTFLHEIDHAQHPWKTEEAVDAHSTERAKAVVAWYGKEGE